jgi:hypothetical protein
MDEDPIRATGTEIGDPPLEQHDPISSNPPRAAHPKRIHLGAPGLAKPISFVPPAMKAMSSSQACTSSASSRVLILNDSFHKMLEYKSKHNKFPSTYDEMVVFLSEVSIQLIFPLEIHSILLIFRLHKVGSLLVFYFGFQDHLQTVSIGLGMAISLLEYAGS